MTPLTRNSKTTKRDLAEWAADWDVRTVAEIQRECDHVYCIAGEWYFHHPADSVIHGPWPNRARAGLEFWAFDRAHPEFDCSEHCPDCDPMACPVFLKCEEIFNKGGRS